LPEIKRFVEFSFLNLADDNYPSPLNNTHDMDVIFCRNVLMYVAADQAERIIQRLHQSLLANRWLIVTPNETSQISRSQFNAATFPGVSFYKKGGDSQPLGTYPDKVNPRLDSADANVFITRQNETVTDASGVESGATRARRINLQEAEPSLLAGALDLYQAGRYDQARQILMMHLEQKPCDFKAMDLLARIYANQGKLKEARGWCEKVLRLDKMNPGSHVLHATILEEQGAIEKASRAFQRALYLDQNLIVAHFALGNIARKQQKIRDAARHFENACLLLRTYGREQILPESEGMTAGRMLEIIHYAGGVSGEIHQAAVENQFMTGRQTTLWPSRGGKNGE
jgi:chemotaxis protein methyltransferase CheR